MRWQGIQTVFNLGALLPLLLTFLPWLSAPAERHAHAMGTAGNSLIPPPLAELRPTAGSFTPQPVTPADAPPARPLSARPQANYVGRAAAERPEHRPHGWQRQERRQLEGG
ncbi:hypothetical protein HNR42_001148 [Deinobacterium chartae]|uniref:Uncharacterized protein n=1 Tax=Deinobacterium chartae TaxID=521158 RepID=A0A841HW23_9DEIO|nr:hypothetical protein [Deinobacterium chartae]MBB6097731.1 hypothetical protein [Deinobacterium chartae]